MSRRIESFAVTLPALDGIMGQSDPVDALEQKLRTQLPDCERLLRWAVTRVEPDSCHCEGAYLKN